MKKFNVQFSTEPTHRPPAWLGRLATLLGGLSIILLAIMVLPLVLLLILGMQVRRLFSSTSKNQEVVFPDWPWEVLVENDHIRIERKLNHGIEKLTIKDNHLAEELEFGDFIAYGIRTTPDIPALNSLYVDYCFEELADGLLLRGLSPGEKRDQDPIYFLDYMDKTLEILGHIPANSEIEITQMKEEDISVKGMNGNDKFELKIRIIDPE